MSNAVVLGFSGGVDSACAAEMLRRRGFDVRCLYLETGSGEAEAARACAKAMGLPLEVIDARAELEKYVCRPFAEAYKRGETPSPCVLCNPEVKLRLLCEYADSLGVEHIATGHYARAEGGALFMGRPENDQSYMLCRILPDQLRRLLLPLGGMAKTETRELAASLGLPAAQKPDSMELCFVPDGDYAAWLEQRGDAPGPGDIIYNGAAVARHGGIHRFTLGQRRGLGYAAGKRVYVSEIRPGSGEVVLADGDGLFSDEVAVRDMRWLVPEPEAPFDCQVRVRHSRTLAPARAYPEAGGRLRLVPESPLRAPTPGQAAALYLDGRVLGGGFVSAARPHDTKDTK